MAAVINHSSIPVIMSINKINYIWSVLCCVAAMWRQNW